VTYEMQAASSLSTNEMNNVRQLMSQLEDVIATQGGFGIISKLYAEVIDPDHEVHLGVIEIHHPEDPACFHQGDHLIYEGHRDDTPEPGPRRHLVLVDDDDQVIARYSGVYDQEKDRD
jgi:hypothetical protein